MNTFFVDSESIKNNLATVSADESHHATNVLRLKSGDEIILTDGAGSRYKAVINKIHKKVTTVEVLDRSFFSKQKPQVCIALGLLKNRQRLEWAIEKMTELGVNSIKLFRSEHTERSHLRLDRLELTAVSAMKQSLGVWLPKIESYDSFHQVLESINGTCFIAHEKLLNQKSFLTGLGSFDLSTELTCLIGPEGGFSDNEVSMAINDFNVKPVHLGPLRLRAETAAVLMAGISSQYMKFENK